MGRGILHLIDMAAECDGIACGMQGTSAGTAWPALGGTSWAAKATTAPVPAQPALPPPPPPVEAVQEWPTLGGVPSDAADALKSPGAALPASYVTQCAACMRQAAGCIA